MKKTILLLPVLLLCLAGSLFAQQSAQQLAQQSTQQSAQQTDPPRKAYLVSNAHLDTQWDWDVQRTIREYIPKTLNQNLFLLGRYPNYVFNFEGGIKYSWMKEYYPLQYEQMKEYIRQGRWHVAGSSWDANDTNIPSPESFTRNILYGQHFFRSEFGVEGTDVFLPDCFGFSYTLPTLAAHSGLIGFSTQKLLWRHRPFHGNSKIPFEIGLWQGIDGSRIMAVANGHFYTKKWEDEDLSHNQYLMDIIDTVPSRTIYHYYGVGDTGGAPNLASVRAIEKSVRGSGPVSIISATSDQIYKDFLPFDAHPELPVFNGELLMDVHATGCYTSQAAMKLYNRRNEVLATTAERSAVAAHWLGGLAYPQAVLDEAWKRFIWHQFHDDLPGTSIPRVYEFSWNDELISLKQFADILTASTGAVSKGLDTRVKGTPLVIFNPLSIPVSDIVEVTLKMPPHTSRLSVYDENGQHVPSQIVGNKDGDIRLLISASAPSCGYVVYDVRPGGVSPKPAHISTQSEHPNAEGSVIENSAYKLTLDANGDIASIYDKRHGKELVEAGKSVRLALFTSNESFGSPAWEIIKKEIDKDPVPIADNVRITIAENGPLRAALCVEKTHGPSTFKQYIRLTEGGQADRIDIYNEVDWQSTNALLKAEFPLTVSNPVATYDLGIGSIQRGNNTRTAYEVCAQQWADLTNPDGTYGVSILNDCKYGWDKPTDNTLRLTLLHTPKTEAVYGYQARQDLGKHHFTYSILPHTGDYRQGGTVLKAEVLNHPMEAFVATKQKGSLGKSFSFLQVDNPNVIMKALKKAETSDEYILRFYETTGKQSQSTTVTLPAAILSAVEVNGMEDEINPTGSGRQTLNFDIKPFGIRSFKVRLQAPGQPVQPVQSVPVSLPYNMKVATYHALWTEANFDRKGHSYAAELYPETLDYKGVHFRLQPSDVNNGMKCRRDTIQLPAGNYTRLHLLAATAATGDRKATFILNDKPVEVTIPSYTGFIGQWGHTGHTEAYLKPADIAYVGTHRHSQLDNGDLPYEYTYMFNITLDVPQRKKPHTLVLPDDNQVVLFATTLINDAAPVEPATDLLKVHLPLKANITLPPAKNLLSGKPIIENTGKEGKRDKAEFAIDNDLNTKWRDVTSAASKYITIDLGEDQPIHGWSVFHAGLENRDFITKDYSFQLKSETDTDWVTVDTVSDNTALETDRLLPELREARYIRLTVTKPDQVGGEVAHICDFRVY